MYTLTQLKNIVFFDLETASGHKNLDKLNIENPALATLWSKRCNYLRDKFEENAEKTDEELYDDKAALHPEFNRIVCASFGRLTGGEDSPIDMIVKSYSGDDEGEILDGIDNVLAKFNTMNLCGHNIKRFDIPVMGKRFLINGKSLPKSLMVYDTKPWDLPFIDTGDIWSFGSWQEGFASLELITAVLGLPTPKSDIRGEDVSGVFWNTQDHMRIAEYCARDVKALADVLLKISKLPAIDGFEHK
jgi:hypothetical protein